MTARTHIADCQCASCWPVHPVRYVGDLTARHLGQTVSIPDLHPPGLDYDAPPVTITGRLDGLDRVSSAPHMVRVNLGPARATLDRPLPLNHRCWIAQQP